jgi:hypothetical protein
MGALAGGWRAVPVLVAWEIGRAKCKPTPSRRRPGSSFRSSSAATTLLLGVCNVLRRCGNLRSLLHVLVGTGATLGEGVCTDTSSHVRISGNYPRVN